MLKTKELKELLERATKGPWDNKHQRFGMGYAACYVAKGQATLQDREEEEASNAKLMEQSPTLAADLIRCRELLDYCKYVLGRGYVGHMKRDEAEKEAISRIDKYLSETEG